MSPDLERLIRLQQLDSDVEARRKTLTDLPAVLQALDDRVNARQSTVSAVKERLTENQAGRRNLEKDLAVVQGRLTRYKDQLMEVKTNKEYGAMQHEIATAEEGVRGFEDKILELLVQADELDGELKAAEAALSEERKAVAAERTAREGDSTRLTAEMEKLTASRAEVVAGMSRDAMRLFEFVSKQRNGRAVAEAREGHCTACHVRLRPHIYNQILRAEQLMQCESCNRILYVMPQKPPNAGVERAGASA
jgi:predicted  nucleic acid-binding Zn-ribbon protein